MVKGIVNFNNLICRSITVASGVMAQTTPTCASPNFIFGFANCLTSIKTLFSVSIKGTNAGLASVSLSSVKVIGAGIDIAYTLQSGSYTIKSKPAPTKPEEPVQTPPTTEILQTNGQNQPSQGNSLEAGDNPDLSSQPAGAASAADALGMR